MSSCEIKKDYKNMSSENGANKPYFGPKQVHHWSYLKVGGSYMFHSALNYEDGVQEVVKPVKVVGIVDEEDTHTHIVIMQVQPVIGEPESICKNKQQLGLEPNGDKGWVMDTYLSFKDK